MQRIADGLIEAAGLSSTADRIVVTMPALYLRAGDTITPGRDHSRGGGHANTPFAMMLGAIVIAGGSKKCSVASKTSVIIASPEHAWARGDEFNRVYPNQASSEGRLAMDHAKSIGKIFSKDKIVPSRVLNMLGVQVLRTVVARSLYNRSSFNADDDLIDKCSVLNRDGILVWPDFLSPEEFEGVRRECFDLLNSNNGIKSRRNGPNLHSRIFVETVPRESIPATLNLLCDRKLVGVLAAAERRPIYNLASLAKVERLIQGPSEQGVDSQTQVHSDIFFTSHKVWFYLTNVTLDDGPLCFMKGSHSLTPRQLFHVYVHSCKRDEENEPSRRVTGAELNKSDLCETIITCPQNTLVIANTCGYHRRLQGTVGRERWAVHIELRSNPFRLGSRTFKGQPLG
jgi:hypothetical protein